MTVPPVAVNFIPPVPLVSMSRPTPMVVQVPPVIVAFMVFVEVPNTARPSVRSLVNVSFVAVKVMVDVPADST